MSLVAGPPVAGSITDWDSRASSPLGFHHDAQVLTGNLRLQVVIGSKTRGGNSSVGGGAAPANRPQPGDKKSQYHSPRERVQDEPDTAHSRAAVGNKASTGPDHAKIAKLDRENEVAPPPTVSLELGKVIQKARQDYVNSAGEKKPLSQGDLAKMLNVKSTVVQECASSSSPLVNSAMRACNCPEPKLTFFRRSLSLPDTHTTARSFSSRHTSPPVHIPTHTLNTQTKT